MNFAKKSIVKNLSNSSSKKTKNNKKNSPTTNGVQRTWLTNVDYKNGGLLSDKKMVRKNVIKKNSTEDRSSDEKKPKTLQS